MSGVKHTRGPWRIEEGANSHCFDGMVVAGFDDCVAFVDLDSANARLISAAPELLEALTGLLSVIDAAGLLNLSNGVQLGPTVWYVKASDATDYARQIVAKATGSTDGDNHEPL